jgi:hypothetical protein
MCVARGFVGPVAIAASGVSARPVVFADEDRRWRIARQLLHDGTVDRAAGLLVLLYGQAVSRIVRLTIDDVLYADGVIQLRLGREARQAVLDVLERAHVTISHGHIVREGEPYVDFDEETGGPVAKDRLRPR